MVVNCLYFEVKLSNCEVLNLVLSPIIDEKCMNMWTKPGSNIIYFTKFHVGVASD